MATKKQHRHVLPLRFAVKFDLQKLSRVEMIHKLKDYAVLVIAFFLLGGVGLVYLVFKLVNPEPPKCDDPQVTELIKKIVWDTVDTKKYRKATESFFTGMMSVELPAPTDYNDKIKKYSCSGKLVITIKSPDMTHLDEQGKNEVFNMVVLPTMLELAGGRGSDVLTSYCKAGTCSVNILYSTQPSEKTFQVFTTMPPKEIVSLMAGTAHANMLVEEAKLRAKIPSTSSSPQ